MLAYINRDATTSKRIKNYVKRVSVIIEQVLEYFFRNISRVPRFVRDFCKVPDVVEFGFEVYLMFGNIAIFQVAYYLAYGCEIYTDLLRNHLLCPALLKERAGYYFYIDVWNCRARLCIMHDLETGSATSESVDIDMPDEMLMNAVYEQGGAINWSGHYAINDEIRERLQQVIGGT